MLRLKGLLLLAFVAAIGYAISAAGSLRAQPPTVSLSGRVSSAEEGAMSGVLVNAQRAGSNIVTTVVTDTQGRYRFPTANVGPGSYAISIRADGYDLVGPTSVDVKAGTPATADLKVTKAARLEDQLSNAEWLNSAPGTDAQKNMLLDCTGCHTLQRVFDSYHTAADWKNNVLPRMTQGYANNSFWLKPQAFAADHARRAGYGFPPELPDYLASINQSAGPRTWPLKTFPRPERRGGERRRHDVHAAQPDDPAARRDPNAGRDGVVRRLRRTESRQAGPEDREDHHVFRPRQ